MLYSRLFPEPGDGTRPAWSIQHLQHPPGSKTVAAAFRPHTKRIARGVHSSCVSGFDSWQTVPREEELSQNDRVGHPVGTLDQHRDDGGCCPHGAFLGDMCSIDPVSPVLREDHT